MQGPERIAQNLGRKNPLKINDLYEYVSAVTGIAARRAPFGAAVEFSARAVAGFAGG
jgi:hypothetical protein